MRMKPRTCDLIVRALWGHGEAARKGVTERDVNPTELAHGIAVESEHVTGCTKLAKKIALDHLAEDQRYYQKLRKAGL